MELVQGSITFTFGADGDSDWVTDSEQTEHRFLGTSISIIQTNSYSRAVRQLEGYVTTTANKNILDTLHQSQDECSFTGDQAGDTATVLIWGLRWDRKFDTSNWQRRRFVLILKRM
jgi:ferric-dicitrate binding protein FerR (iron transport regulator)